MTRRLAPLLLAPLLLAASAAGPPEVEALLRAGQAAFERGDYALAAGLYEQAEVRATDPVLTLYNQAAALYHLARQGDAKALAAAEEAYRTCAAVKGRRRAPSLFGLANCLLLRGGQGQPDGLVLRVAIDTYTRCLRDPGCDEALAADARYNQGRARLLLLQAPPGQGSPALDDPGGEEGPGEDKDRPGEGEKKEGHSGDSGQPRPAPGAGGAPEKEGDGPREGGEGGRGVPLPPVSDRPDSPNLPREEAAALLQQASRRIVEDWQNHRRAMKRPSPPGARDW